MSTNVNFRGVKGLIKVIDDLQNKGYYTFFAFDDHSPVDLIAMSPKGKTFRLQIKYRSKDPRKKSERYNLYSDSVVNGKRIPIDRNLIDGWAVYLAGSNRVIYIKTELLENKKSLCIDPKNNYGELDEWFISAPC